VKRTCVILALVTLGFLRIGSLRADDPQARAVLDRAIKVLGDERKLDRFKAATWKGKGTFHGLGFPLPYTGEFAVFAPHKSRVVLDSEADGKKFRIVNVINNDKGWSKFNDMVQEMKPERLAEEKEEHYAGWVAMLTPLRDKAFSLTMLPEVKLGNRTYQGVKVSRMNHRDVHLYFDKETGLLSISATQVVDEQTGKMVEQEVYYNDYQVVDGVRYPMKITILRSRKTFVETNVTDFKPAEKLDDNLFAKP
jgi:hypothetical protein